MQIKWIQKADFEGEHIELMSTPCFLFHHNMDNEVEDIRAKVPKADLNTTLGTLYPLFPEIWEQEQIPVD